MHKKVSFPLSISSVNVTESADQMCSVDTNYDVQFEILPNIKEHIKKFTKSH